MTQAASGRGGYLRNLTACLSRFLADVDSRSFPKASRVPWVSFRTEDSTALVVDHVNAFTRDFAGRRPLPFRARALGDWLGPPEAAAPTGEQIENWGMQGDAQWRA